MKRNILRTFLPLIVVILMLLLLSTGNREESGLFRRTRLLMGTVVEISVPGEGDRARMEAAVDEAFGEMARLENLLGRRQKGSDVWKLNHNPGVDIPVSAETLDAVSEGLRISDISRGAFDITLGRLMELWNFEDGREAPPSPEAVEKALKSSGSGNVKIDVSGGTIRLLSGIHLDLGGIAKGYIIDRAAELLVGRGVKNFIVNAGGDMVITGRKGKKPWRIGLQHPRREGEVVAHVDIDEDVAIVTSGDYERYFIHDGRRYHHILNPSTGYPAEGLMSVTITAGDAKTADAICTAVFVLGVEEGMELIDSLDGIEGMIVDRDGEKYLSAGLKGKVVPR